jgi:ribosomal protein S18 acetylase RimI-like enzyme
MTLIRYREAIVEDVLGMESVRAPDSEAGPADVRMARYLRGEHHPQQALMPRVMYVAADTEAVVGYIGGHLTHRYGCDGELQYLYVTPCHRRCGVASGMLHVLWRWFLERDASRICVDVEPDNAAARGFYLSHGATYLNSHWLVWPDIRGP